MPAGLSEDEIKAAVADAVAASGAAGPQDMGKVMALIKPKMPKGTDMGLVSSLIKQALSA
ncbi:MAG: GatB/YqeY domain-containing protein, partial [Massilia sp.]